MNPTLNHASRTRTAFSQWAVIFALLMCFNLAAQSAFAQETLTGVVTNAATGRTLEGARVVLQGTGRETTTDRTGSYRFQNVAPGSVTVSVTYTGLNPLEIPVVVSAGGANRGDAKLTADIYTLSKFVVAGEREGNAQAITLQRISNGVKTIASTDAFGSLPGNPAELALRLPGVEGVACDGDTRYLRIRGMSSNLSSITMDGNRLADAASAGTTREYQFQQIGSDSIERIEVVKSPTPDMDGDSIGGNVNMVSKGAFDSSPERRIRGSFGAIMRPFDPRETRAPRNYSISYSEVFAGKFGIALNAAYRVYTTPQDGIFQNHEQLANGVAGPGYTYRVQYFDQLNERARSGAGLKLDYKLSDTSRFYFNITRNRMVEPATQHYTYYTTSQTIATRDAAGNLTGTGAVLPEYTKTLSEWRPVAATNVQAYSVFTWKHVTSLHRDIGGVHKFGSWGIDYNLFASDATTHYPHQESVWIRASGIGIRVQDTDKPYFPAVTQTAGPDILNPNSYAENQYDLTHSKGKDSYRGVALNLK